MPRYLVRFRPDYKERVRDILDLLDIVPVARVFDYLTLEIPQEIIPEVKKIPGVVEVRLEKMLLIMRRLPIPIDKKLARFMELAQNPLTLLEAIRFSIEADIGKNYWPTAESRRVLGADEAEAEGYTGEGIKIAVLDTGIDPTLPQLLGAEGESSQEGQPLWWDENGHGSHVATTIGGKLQPTPWGAILGVAPDCEIRNFKCLGYGVGAGSETGVMRAMMDAFRWGADILSASLGSSYSEEPADRIPECRAIKMLTDQGIINIWANGNDGPDERTVGVPACSPYAISVGAIDKQGVIANFSSRGPTQDNFIKPDVVAPGVDILSSTATASIIDNMQFMDGPRLACISGTSMATPHCAGMVALIKQLYREEGIELTTNMIKDAMDRYGQPKDNSYGWGLLTWNIAKRYLEEVLKPRPPPPVVPEMPPELEE